MRRILRSALVVLLAAGSMSVPTPETASAAGSFPFTGLIDLDVGFTGACTVSGSGSVACWGRGLYGLFAAGNGRSRTTPTNVAGITEAVEVSVGATIACARLSTGAVQCWGDNAYLQSGSPGFISMVQPQTVPNVSNAVAVAAGGQHACALIQDGSVTCWGGNQYGQSGQVISSTVAQPPTTVPDLTNVVEIDAGMNSTCVRRSDATMRCFGVNDSGQLGNGTLGTPSATPVSPGLNGVLDISVGYNHVCAIVQSGADEVVRCWGNDQQRKLGGATAGTAVTPKPAAAAITDAVQVSADVNNTCVVRATGAVVCWGANFAGQLGIGSVTGGTPTPTLVTGVSNASEVGVGFAVCTRLDTGSIKCWGYNTYGAVGVGASDSDATAHTSPQTLALPIPEFSPITPARILDTRTSGDTVDGESEKGGLVAANAVVEVRVRNRAGVPMTSPAVVLNITAVSPAGTGFVTVWPCDETKPLASNLNVTAGVNRANVVVAKVASSGPKADKVCLSPSVSMHLLADASGFFSAAGDYASLSPARLLDTRANGQTVDGQFKAGGSVVGGSVVQLTVGGRGGVTASAIAAVLNVTAVQATGNGFVTVWPCGQSQPTASNLNVKAGVTVANLSIAALSATKVCISPSVTMHLVVDVAGYLPTGSPYVAATPFRLLDTRANGVTIDGQRQGEGPFMADEHIAVQVAGRGETTFTAGRTVVLNLTAVQPTGTGYLSVVPCRYLTPVGGVPSSNLNVTAGVTSAVSVVVEIGSSDSVCIYSSVGTHVVLDVQGWYAY